MADKKTFAPLKISLPERLLLASFWWLLWMAFILWVPFLRVWWWVLFPFLLSIELRKLYLWWLEWDHNYQKNKWILLEVTPPKEVLVPLKAMEDVLTVIWPSLYAPPNFREIWAEGVSDDPNFMSFEITGIEGTIHFYIRIESAMRASVESAFYAHFPDLEIREVSDYTTQVPQNVPNEEWDTYGEDFILGREAPYPIKTYEKFFEPQGEKISAEEKRIDPIASLLEQLSKLGPGEQYWLQFLIGSVDAKEEPHFEEKAKKIIAKVAHFPEKKVLTFWDYTVKTIRDLALGPEKEGDSYEWKELKATEDSTERELLLTPGEREILTEVETKLKKPIFRTVLRGVYTAKRENWKGAHKILARSYFSHFQTQNLNHIRFSVATRPKTKYFFRKSIPFIRSKRMFRNYVLRFTPFFPNMERETCVLNTEELTTMFHFPTKITGMALPMLQKVESKKGGPPPNLPV